MTQPIFHDPEEFEDDRVDDDFDEHAMLDEYFKEEERLIRAARWRAIGHALKQWCKDSNDLPSCNSEWEYQVKHYLFRLFYTIKAILCLVFCRFGNTHDEAASIRSVRRYGVDTVCHFNHYTVDTEDGTDYRCTVVNVGGGVFHNWRVSLQEDGSL